MANSSQRSANSVSNLQELFPDHYRNVVYLAKTAISIVVTISNEKSAVHVNNFFVIMEQLHDFHLSAAASFFLGSTQKYQGSVPPNVSKLFDNFREALQEIWGTTRFLKAAIDERIQQRIVPAASDESPTVYDLFAEQVSEYLRMLTDFVQTYEIT